MKKELAARRALLPLRAGRRAAVAGSATLAESCADLHLLPVAPATFVMR